MTGRSHADVIREALERACATIEAYKEEPWPPGRDALAALDALEAENQQLHDAARAYLDTQDKKHQALASPDAETFESTFFVAHEEELEAWARLRRLVDAERLVPVEPGRQP